MQKPFRSKSSFIGRIAFIMVSFLYLLSLNFAHRLYLQPNLEFWGFPYNPIGPEGWLFAIGSTALVATILPMKMARPSALILFVIYLLVFLPSVIITLGVSDSALNVYGAELCSFVFGFLVAIFLTRAFAPSEFSTYHFAEINLRAEIFLVIFTVLLLVFVFISFRDVINFVGLDDIYAQREAGRSNNMIQAYAQTYLAYVFSPGLFALGLYKRNVWYLAFGSLGFLLMFGVTAEKTIFLFPFAIVAISYFVKRAIVGITSVIWTVGVLSLIIYFLVILSDFSVLVHLVALFFIFRLIAIPGAMFWQYSDVFGQFGYTYWSNVAGISSFVDVPSVYRTVSNWPQLGYLVADNSLGLVSNSNANLFAYDGIAGAGPVGVVLVSIALGCWLIVLDRAARFVNPILSLTMILPMAVSLTNGSLFSLMLSFGGFFWMIFFFIAFPRKNRGSQIRGTNL